MFGSVMVFFGWSGRVGQGFSLDGVWEAGGEWVVYLVMEG